MDNNLRHFRQSGSKKLIHPSSPSGGCGPGNSCLAGPIGNHGISSGFPQIGSPADRHFEWHSFLGARSQYEITLRLANRIRTAQDLNEMLNISSDLHEAKERYIKLGLLRKPNPGDKEVFDAVKLAFEDCLGGFFQKLIFSSAWTLAEMGIDETIKDAFKKAFWEALKELRDTADIKIPS